MNKTFTKISAALFAAALSVNLAVYASACPVENDDGCIPTDASGIVSLSRIDDSTEFNCFPNFGAEILIKNRSVKNKLVVDYDEVLVIPAGKKLVLNKGAHINGTLYIEEGGSLAVRGGTLVDCGSIVCDGTISVGERGGLSIHSGASFVVTNPGTLKYSADTMSVSGLADYACFGTLKHKYLDSETEKSLLTKPIYGIIISDGSTVAADEKQLSEYVSGINDYLSGDETGKGSYDLITLLLDNGTCVKIRRVGGKTTTVGNVKVSDLKDLAAETLQLAAENKN